MSEAPSLFHWIVGALALMSGLSVVLLRNAVISAMFLMTTLFLTGGLFFSMGAWFIGAVQILVYAGAISVLFVFVVMLLDLKPLKVQIPGRKFNSIFSALIGLTLLVSLCYGILAFFHSGTFTGGEYAFSGNEMSDAANTQLLIANSPKTISLRFLSKYMVPFQMTGFLILASILGVILLGRPERTRSSKPIEGNQ